MTTEEQEFQELLQDKRHKEIIKSLSTIAMALNSDEKSDDEIVKAIKGQGENVNNLIKSIQNIPKSQAPIVNINQKEISDSLNKICADIVASNNKVIETLEKRLLPHSFELVKSFNGVTESVKVNYKPANKI